MPVPRLVIVCSARRSRWAALALPRTLALALVFASVSARADDDAGGADEVLVRGDQASGFVSRAGVDDAPREITDAASLVEPMPGVHVRRLGADDSFATLSIRGSTSTQVAVYLAGVPLSGGADPTLDLATLPLWPGAEARVHRSFAPAALGRGSLGGTLVIAPPSPRASARTDVWTAIGSFGGMRLRVGDVRGDPDGVRVASGVSASRSDDDFTYLDANATAAAGHDVFTTRKNAGHAAAAGLASIALPVRAASGQGALTITSLAQARRQELSGSVRYPTYAQRLDSSRLVSALELTVPAGARVTFVTRGWGRREGLSIRDDPRSARVFGAPSSTDDVIVAAGASTGVRGRPTEASAIELRIDGSAERFAPSWRDRAPPPAARRVNGGLGVDANARIARALTASASGRLDTWIDASDAGPTTGEVRPTSHVGVEVPVGPVILASHAGFVARPPSFVERYGNRGGFLGNEALRPESAWIVDAGARLGHRLGPVRLHAEAAGFATWAHDLITLVYRGAYRSAQATNIGRARLLGLEAEVRASAYGFEARASHTAIATENESECAALGASRCERPPLPGRPAHDFVADLSFRHGPVRLRYGLDVVAGTRADLSGTILVPARALHSAGARLVVPGARGFSLALDVRNLFDLQVAEYAGISVGGVARTERVPTGDIFDYPLPGRSVLFSARWTSDAQ